MKTFLVFILIISTQVFGQKSSVYFSPGVSLSFDSDFELIFSYKITLGIYQKEEHYYGVTYGKSWSLEAYKEKSSIQHFAELNYGTFNKYPYSWSISIGGAIDKNKKLHPQFSCDYGNGLFVNGRYIVSKDINLGLLLVAPLTPPELGNPFKM